MPVIAAVLFEFCLQESRSRAAVRRRQHLGAMRWLYVKEGLRIRLRMAADQALSADDATRQVRVESAAVCLYRLREAIIRHESGRDGASSGARRIRRAHRRAQAALARAGFADASIAADVLRHVQVLTMTARLASLDYTTPDDACTAGHGQHDHLRRAATFRHTTGGRGISRRGTAHSTHRAPGT
jgi:hypothetical protein